MDSVAASATHGLLTHRNMTANSQQKLSNRKIQSDALANRRTQPHVMSSSAFVTSSLPGQQIMQHIREESYLSTVPALCEQLILGHQWVAIPFTVVIINHCVIVQSRLNEASAGVIWDCSWCGSCSGVVAYNNASAALDLVAPAGNGHNHLPACKRLANKAQPANVLATCVTATCVTAHKTNCN